MKKAVRFSILALILGMSIPAFIGTFAAHEVQGYSTSSLPTTIDLNPVDESDIQDYYASLNNLSTSERQGPNLLKNLKTILKNGQKYYSYDSGDTIWKMYEITDRDWTKSPASSISGYNSTTKKITGYSYNSTNPYVHALYINRDVTNQTKAWGNHNQDEWGINREHVWPKAEGFETEGAGGARGDPMHLMAGNGYSNNIHSNYYYGYVDTSKSYTNCGSKYSNQDGNLRGVSKTVGGSTNVFEPQDCDKGDIARAIFYMVARYNYLSGKDSDGIDSNNPNLTLTQSLSDWASSGYSSTTSKQGKMGLLTDLLNWHRTDPVDSYEINRNNLLYTNFTGNRNPFIDHPEWVDFIWGKATYSGKTYQSYSETPTGYASKTDTLYGYNSSETVSVTGVSLDNNTLSVEKGSSKVLTATVAPSNATNQNVTWSSANTAIATVSSSGTVTGVAEGSTTITVTTQDGNKTASCTVTVTAPVAPVSGETISFSRSNSTNAVTQGYIVTKTNGSDNASYYQDSSVGIDVDITKSDSSIIWEESPNTISLTANVGGGSAKDPLTNNVIAYFLDSSNNAISSSATTVTTKVESQSGNEYTVSMPKTNNVYGIRLHHTKVSGHNVRLFGYSLTYETLPTLESISLDTEDVQKNFFVGDDFTYEGLSVTANYSNGTSDFITPTSVSSPDMSTAGTKTITVSYTEGDVTETATYDITVSVDPDAGKTTLSVIIADYADDHSWVTNTKYTTVNIDENVTAAVTTGSTNTGKYVVSGETWRFYEGENGTLTISTSSEFIIDRITIFYSSYNDGAFFDENNQVVTSGNEITINASSASFTVDNTGSTYSNGQARVTSITVTYHIAEEHAVTSISATVSKSYHPGDTISASDVIVKDNNNHNVSTFTLVNDGYQFKYSDAPSGGSTGTKEFTVTATPESEELSCTLTVEASRNNYIAPADVEYSLSTTKGSFSSLEGSSSSPKTNSMSDEGVTFKATKSYKYSNTLAIKSSYSQDDGGYVGQGIFYNETEFPTPIKTVSIAMLDDRPPYQIEFSKDGSTGWTSTNDGKMTYFRITFTEAWASGYINISSIVVTTYGSETALNVANYIMFEDTNGQCETKFDIAETYFGNMTTAERTTFMTSNDYVIKEARTRLQDWAKHLGKQIINENSDYFIRAVRPVSNIISSVNSNETAIIVVISILSIGTIGGYLYLRKKRHE